MMHTEICDCVFSITINGIWATLAPGTQLFPLIIILSYNLGSSLSETHRLLFCNISLYLFFFIKILYKLTLISIRQYILGRKSSS